MTNTADNAISIVFFIFLSPFQKKSGFVWTFLVEIDRLVRLK